MIFTVYPKKFRNAKTTPFQKVDEQFVYIEIPNICEENVKKCGHIDTSNSNNIPKENTPLLTNTENMQTTFLGLDLNFWVIFLVSFILICVLIVMIYVINNGKFHFKYLKYISLNNKLKLQ